MADNQGFSPAPRGDQELVFSTHTGDSAAVPAVAATGLVTPLYREVDASGAANYYLMDGSAYVPDLAVEMVDTAPVRVNLAQEALALDGTVKQFASVPANAVLAEVQVHVGEEHAAWTTGGNDPDVANHIGRLTMAGKSFDVEGMNEVANFKGMALANDGSTAGTEANLYVEYFNVTEDGTYAK